MKQFPACLKCSTALCLCTLADGAIPKVPWERIRYLEPEAGEMKEKVRTLKRMLDLYTKQGIYS